jgi:hypothetical protein
MRHGRRRRRAVPVLHAGRNPDDVAGADLLNGATPMLHQSHTGCDDECLAEWMRVPSSTRAGLEDDRTATDPCRRASLKSAIDADSTGEIVRGTNARRLSA